MNKQTQETKDKRKKTKEENLKKILTVCGYEIWRDPLNYTTVKDRKNLYFPTFRNALIDIRNELIRNKLAGVENLEKAISAINASDSRFLEALSVSLAGLGEEFRA